MCSSKRATYEISLQSHELGNEVLLQFFSAMGLPRQTKDQQVFLALVDVYELAQEVVRAACDLLQMQRATARSVDKDPKVVERQIRDWQT